MPTKEPVITQISVDIILHPPPVPLSHVMLSQSLSFPLMAVS